MQINLRARVHIPIIDLRKTDTVSTAENMEPIIRYRRHLMDSAILRVMKDRKQLKHAELVSQVIRQLAGRFTPKPVDINKRITFLIELEHMTRSQHDRYELC